MTVDRFRVGSSTLVRNWHFPDLASQLRQFRFGRLADAPLVPEQAFLDLPWGSGLIDSPAGRAYNLLHCGV